MSKYSQPARLSPTVVVLLSLVVVAGGVAGLLLPDMGPAVGSSVLLGVVGLTVWQRLSPLWESPALMLYLFLSASAVAGIALTPLLLRVGGTGGVLIELTPRELLQTAALFVVFATLSALAAAIVVGPRRDVAIERTPFGVGGQWAAVSLASLTLIANVALRGYSSLLSRVDRFEDSSSQLSSGLALATIASVVALGAALTGPKRAGRILSVVLLLLIGLLYFALATRTLSLMPLLILAGAVLAGWRRHLLGASAIALGATVLLAPVPLFTRSLGSHGLLPYFNGMSTYRLNSVAWLESVNNFVSGFSIVGATAFQRPAIGREALLISLSPTGGASAGWYEISDQLRLNYYTPYGALGEIGNQGWPTVVLLGLVIGAAAGAIQRIGRTLQTVPLLATMHLAAIGLMFLFAVQFTQYNLRSEMRLLYYALSLDVILLIVHATRRSLNARVPSNRQARAIVMAPE